MKKKVLCAFMALALFVSCYAVLPKQLNPFPTNTVCAWSGVNRTGAYKVVESFIAKNELSTYLSFFSRNSVIVLDSRGRYKKAHENVKYDLEHFIEIGFLVKIAG